MKHLKLYSLIFLLLITIFIFYAAFHENTHGLLRISYMNVGKGEAIFIESPTGNHILIDAGSNKTILTTLGNSIPFYDRTLDALIVMSLDEKFIGGVPNVLENYSVKNYFSYVSTSSSSILSEIQKDMQNKNIPNHIFAQNETISIGGGAYIQIISLQPTIMKLIYQNTSFLLAADTVPNASYISDGTNIEKI